MSERIDTNRMPEVLQSGGRVFSSASLEGEMLGEYRRYVVSGHKIQPEDLATPRFNTVPLKVLMDW